MARFVRLLRKAYDTCGESDIIHLIAEFQIRLNCAEGKKSDIDR